jgi:ClpP class serine protease
MSGLGTLLTGSLALEPGALDELVARGGVPALSGGDLPAWYRAGSVAVVPIAGALAKGAGVSWAGLTGYDQVRSAFAAALADRETSSILLHVDSPGGHAVEAVLALADEIYAARKIKPSVALVEDVAASAAYLIAAAAGRIVLSGATSRVGSIGVLGRHIDESRALDAAGLTVSLLAVGSRKADGAPEVPLSAEARARIMAELSAFYSEFTRRVAAFRGLTVQAVEATEAGVFQGAEALRFRLADEIATPSALLARLASSHKGNQSDMHRLSIPTGGISAAVPGTTTGVPAPLAAPAAAPSAASSSSDYIAGIQQLGQRFRIPADTVLATMGRGLPLESVEALFEGVAMALDQRAGAAMMAALAADGAGVQPVTPVDPMSINTAGSPAVRRAAMTEALAHRLRPQSEPSERARAYLGASLADLAAECLEIAGEGRQRRSPVATIEAALAHSTSDFPRLLGDAGAVSLIQAYEAAPPALRPVARKVTATNYKKMSRVRLGEHPSLLRVPETGKIEYGSTGEAGEKFSVSPYARLFAITRQALVNDSLGAFADWVDSMANAAVELEAAELAALLLANDGAGPIMEDGKSLFHTDHRNLAPAGTSITDASLSAARLALRTQRGIDGVTPVNIVPRFLVVGPLMETEAERYLAQLQPARTADVNPFASKLELIVEGRIDDFSWYVIGSPIATPAMEYAYLNDRGPAVDTMEGWTRLGVEVRITHDFGCGAVDWRPAYRNPGAAPA